MLLQRGHLGQNTCHFNWPAYIYTFKNNIHLYLFAIITIQSTVPHFQGNHKVPFPVEVVWACLCELVGCLCGWLLLLFLYFTKNKCIFVTKQFYCVDIWLKLAIELYNFMQHLIDCITKWNKGGLKAYTTDQFNKLQALKLKLKKVISSIFQKGEAITV